MSLGGDCEEEDGGEEGAMRGPPINDRVTRRIHLVDTWSKVMFPACYILFHICYWLFYIFYETDEWCDLFHVVYCILAIYCCYCQGNGTGRRREINNIASVWSGVTGNGNGETYMFRKCSIE